MNNSVPMNRVLSKLNIITHLLFRPHQTYEVILHCSWADTVSYNTVISATLVFPGFAIIDAKWKKDLAHGVTSTFWSEWARSANKQINFRPEWRRDVIFIENNNCEFYSISLAKSHKFWAFHLETVRKISFFVVLGSHGIPIWEVLHRTIGVPDKTPSLFPRFLPEGAKKL